LRDGQAVVGGLLGDLLQPIDTAELDLGSVAAELVDCAREPFARLALPGQVLGDNGLLTVLGKLLETQGGTGQDGQPADGLQCRGPQVVLEFEAAVGQLHPVTFGESVQHLGGERRREPLREDHDAGDQQPDDGHKTQDQQGLKQPACGCNEAIDRGEEDESEVDAAASLGPAVTGGSAG
jgi:hypothetical protein